MTEHFFGLHNGHLTARADKIAKRHDAWHVNFVDPCGNRPRGWFACPNLGEPFDSDTAKAVMADIEQAGGIESLRKKGT